MLDTDTINIIKATVPAVKANADNITACFYPLMFKQHPEVIPFFNQTNQAKGSQPKALANAVVAYAANIDELGNLSEAVSKIVQKHCSLDIQPAHYDIVGSCLLQAIAKVLGDAATPEIIDAWGKAYGQLAKILIDAEESIYAGKEQNPGWWRGEREFTLVKKQQESSVISSFYFKPSDKGQLPDFTAGQFISLVLEIKGQKVRRNYSLSDAPGKGYLRISVKRESEGLVSNYLHDELALGQSLSLLAPCGDFVLRDNNKPLVLVTGGVGITPAISMLNASTNGEREIRFIHAALNSDAHAFKDHVDQLATTRSNLTPLYVYNQPSDNCQAHATGFITPELIASQLPEDRDVEFYLLGPKPFMVAAFNIAKQLGVPEGQIHFEFFGPSEELRA
ncbi:NO-inducible flavohemoprotein [Agarivorans sp. 1_MG-2023]|uniref:NO-inducible flavohemoprotein n=1 Tax=Agarivorans sp. 1_MG-2023 TaxID=3062634 RepID=UPI0026E2109D|nr:NO-inducible flavohemoprotein [Agarivorans sp. 1_MG-2023]MDO6763627.1 NO-inducible flavohemoprotein [Agarivorans sp. 1_MG-2023]